MRTLLCAFLVVSSFAAAEAQSRAPLHHAGKVVKNRYHRIGHNVRATKRYFGHKYRGMKKAIKN